MKTEFEVRFLNIDKQDIIKKLNSLGAEFVGEWLQIRNVYDFNPVQENSWVRLRTNGKETTLAIKEVKCDTVDGTKELEVAVSDFNETDLILNKLGYVARNRQENKRARYILDGVEIDIDTWPLIPTYIEIEADSEDKIKKICTKLGMDYKNACTLNNMNIYLQKYNIDISKIKNLIF